VWHTETPIIRTAPAPLYKLSRLVRDSDFKVVLTGEGADEIFAGYNIFKEDKVRRFWAREPDSSIRPRLLEKLYPYVFSKGGGKAKTFLENFFKKGLTDIDSPVYSHMLRWQNTSQLRNFFTGDMRKQTGNLNNFIERYVSMLPENFMSWDTLSRAQHTESTLFLSNYLLSSQGDRMAMGNSVEGRYPFLDHRVVEFAAKIPPRFLMNGLTEKFILKQAATGLIPSELIDRPKQPYRAPISHCFFPDKPPDYVEEMLSENVIREKGYFDHKKVKRLVKKCKQQQGNLLSERENMAIVAILSTQLADHMFINKFPFQQINMPLDVKVYKG
jgi:asparagine synthase (glutamine-hydrolysing)